MCELVNNYAKEYAKDYAKDYANKKVENRNISLAKKMLAKGKPLAEILDFSELTVEKIQEIAKEMGKTIIV